MCILCGHPDLVHLAGPDTSLVAAAALSGGQNRAVAAGPATPAVTNAEIAFLSGVTTNATVAATSFWTWNDNNPATYSNTSWDAKWGSTTLSTSGTPGGNVTYWFDTASNWSNAEKT